MARKQTNHLMCDRCGEIAVLVPLQKQPDNWLSMIRDTAHEGPTDLCAECVKSFKNWWIVVRNHEENREGCTTQWGFPPSPILESPPNDVLDRGLYSPDLDGSLGTGVLSK